MNYQAEREEFVYQIAKEGGTLVAARDILKHANTLQRLAVASCNRELTAQELRNEARAGLRTKESAATFGAKTKLGGDPRGCVVKLILKSGKYNGWGGAEDGYCVPTRPY